MLTILGAGALTGAARGVPPAPLRLTSREAVRDSIKRRDSTPRSTSGLWTVEAADVANAVAADSLLRWLVLRGYDARIVGRQAPFRVRIGHFPSMRDAMAVARRLLRPGFTPFVTEGRE